MKLPLFFAFQLIGYLSFSQVDPARVTIARDSFGVPHIFAETDAGASYGLAWAHAEDDFKNIQYVLLPSKGMLGRVLGKTGAEADYVSALFRCRDIVKEKIETLSPEFLEVVNGYVQGLNDYARTHPTEILVKNAFPVTVEDYLTAVSFSLCIISGVDRVLPAVLGGNIETIPEFMEGGSNAFAIHPSMTNTGEAFLAINSHQPLEGPVAWYEAHLYSDEGLNILGGLFPGSLCINHGVNEHLGWAHTVNNMDKIDVYQLKMHPMEKEKYQFDSAWISLESRKVRLKVKGIPITINKKIYWSRYGATLKTKKGYFAIRLTANQDIRAMEQWWRMNKANNFSSFYQALSMQALPMFNIVYADRYDTIFYISGGKMPLRKSKPVYHWSGTLPGNTSETLWTDFHSISDLPQYINPSSGYLFNTNHSPFLASGPPDNLNPDNFDPTSGYERFQNNRSKRFSELISTQKKMEYDQFLNIKYDNQLPEKLQYPYQVDSLFHLDTTRYPSFAGYVKLLNNWDRKSDTGSQAAAIFVLIYRYIASNPKKWKTNQLTTTDASDIYDYVRNYLEKYFDGKMITLGELQKLVRGKKEEPIWGIPDVITAIYSGDYRNGRLRAYAGESYIELVRFSKDKLPEIESINCYGSSAHPESIHFNDQMNLFLRKQRKKMTLDRSEVLRNAVSIYHPLALPGK